MYELTMYRPITEARARDELTREFPRIPARIIASVLAAYRRVTPTVDQAERASRERLRDACAL